MWGFKGLFLCLFECSNVFAAHREQYGIYSLGIDSSPYLVHLQLIFVASVLVQYKHGLYNMSWVISKVMKVVQLYLQDYRLLLVLSRRRRKWLFESIHLQKVRLL